ncbi:MAG TPA: helix-turn-helix domain-containing protein [Actinomycetes bacterium]|nr:helix-turn-helix domain-containing protein [Actinomycetes bacterium]
MRKRAEQVDHTRQRIVEAAVHLHGTVGPAATTIAGIAEQAGVTRLTVYRHFPDEEALYLACSAHWTAQQVPPDPDAWAKLADPTDRLRAGLADLYRYYRQGEAMLTRVYRDKQTMREQLQEMVDRTERHHRDVLLEPFASTRAQRRRLRAVLGHAVSFWTWRSLCLEGGLSDREAVDAMTALALATAAGSAPAP